MLQAVRDGGTQLPGWGEVPPRLRAALERAELAQRLRPALSSQHLPSPVLTTAAALRSTAGRCPAASGQLASAPWAGRRGKRRLGSHTALALPLAPAQATRRSGGSPGDPAALHQAPAEGAEQPPCRECPSCLCSAPRCCSSPASGASLLTFCSFPLAQATTLHASSLERLVESQAKVRVTRGIISAVPSSHTWPKADAACRGPFLLRGCWVSAACCLQAGAEQRPPPVPSGSQGGPGRAAGEFGEDGGRMALLSSSRRRALLLHWGCCCPSRRARPSPLLCGRRELSPRGPSFPNDASPVRSAAGGQR